MKMFALILGFAFSVGCFVALALEPRDCALCAGTGTYPEESGASCPACGGEGKA